MKTEVKKRRPYRKTKKDVPTLINKNELIDKLIKSLSEMSGYTGKQIYETNTHDASWWRQMAVYILAQEFDWTQEAAGKAFGISAAAVNHTLNKFDNILAKDEADVRFKPYLEKAINDVVL
tara:strand:- start:13435 stop:13797 length:363 start_codon:yes stop_codon:yes gene_type:complete